MLSALKEMAWVDLLALGACTVLMVAGFVRGCSGEIGRLVALGGAVALGGFGFGPLSQMILSAPLFGATPYAARLVAYILLFVVCVALWLLLRRVLSDAISLVLNQPFDAILGGIIGGVKAFILIAVLCAFGFLNPNEAARTRFQHDSLTARHLAPFLERITSPGLTAEKADKKQGHADRPD
jgi:uncharacterized membrane protein required for colicin V production